MYGAISASTLILYTWVGFNPLILHFNSPVDWSTCYDIFMYVYVYKLSDYLREQSRAVILYHCIQCIYRAHTAPVCTV